RGEAMSEDIKTCAHCGSPAMLQEHPAHSHAGGVAAFMPDYPGSATITCCNDDCSSGMIGSTVEEVTAAWNRRAILSASASPKPDMDAAKRLRLLCNMLGLKHGVPDDDAMLMECQFSVFG